MPAASLDSIHFDTARYESLGNDEGQRVWLTPQGDAISLNFFAKPPDILPDAKSEADLQEYYRSSVCNEQIRMVEFRLARTAGMPCLWMILKIRQQPTGMTYLGSLTIPFADFSFVLKMQCAERGITGMRDTALFIKAQQAGQVTITDDGKVVGDWNADDAAYDALFPDHPLSRLRHEFPRIMESLVIDETVKGQNPFGLPLPTSSTSQAGDAAGS
jgi:hypothetical protein